MTSDRLRSGTTVATSFVVVVVTYVVLHEVVHVAINWFLAGRLATRCGVVPVIYGPNWAYVAVCSAQGGSAGVNAAATLAVSGLFGGVVAIGAHRLVEDLSTKVGSVVAASFTTVHLATYVLDTGTLGPEESMPTDSAVVLDRIGVLGLLPAAVAVALSLVAIAVVSWRLVPAVWRDLGVGPIRPRGRNPAGGRQSGSGGRDDG